MIIRLVLYFLFCIPTLSFGDAAFIDEVYKAAAVSGGTSCTSGNTAIGDDSDMGSLGASTSNTIHCWRKTATCSGDIDELAVYIGGLSSSEDITMGIYSDKTTGCTDSEPHCPDTLLSDTAALSGNDASPGEDIIGALDSSVTLTEDDEYWICVGETDYQGAYPRDADSGGDTCSLSAEYADEGTLPTTIACGNAGVTDGTVWGIAE